jgi:hypothetical protein
VPRREGQREEERMGNLGFPAAAEGLYRPATVGGGDLGPQGRGGGSGGLPSDTELVADQRKKTTEILQKPPRVWKISRKN